MRIFEETNTDWFYMQLHMFKKGVIDHRALMNQEIIHDVKPNGIVTLRFDNNEDYFKLFDLSEYDVRTLSHLFSYYGYNEFFSSYQANDDWDEGYVMNHFNEENLQLVSEIMEVLSPGLDVDNHENYIKMSDVLKTTFEKRVSTIIDEYYSAIESSMTTAVELDAKDELCNIFEEDGIYNNDSCFYKYFTTINNLIKLYDTLKCKALPLYDMLKKLGHTKDVRGDYGVEVYDLNYMKHFDSEQFNRVVKSNLEDIVENLHDSDRFKNIDEYKEIVKKLSKFKFGKWFNLPKDKNKMFKIINVDPETNEIIFEYKKTNTQNIEKGSVTYERFILFLYHPELF